MIRSYEEAARWVFLLHSTRSRRPRVLLLLVPGGQISVNDHRASSLPSPPYTSSPFSPPLSIPIPCLLPTANSIHTEWSPSLANHRFCWRESAGTIKDGTLIGRMYVQMSSALSGGWKQEVVTRAKVGQTDCYRYTENRQAFFTTNTGNRNQTFKEKTKARCLFSDMKEWRADGEQSREKFVP